MVHLTAALTILAGITTSSYGFSSFSSQLTRGKRWSTQSQLSLQEDSVDSMKSEIADMRQEALRRIDALNAKFSRSNATADTVCDDVVKEVKPPEGIVFEPLLAVSNKPTAITERPSYDAKSIARVKKQEVTSLIDGTRWKIMLNIGREPGTWMPKTWGISGERLLLNLEVEFSPQQLYEREEFLNGMADAKVLLVVNNELTMGPSMTEGARKIPVKSGGWRVSQREGPMGTDLLRFYIELEDEVRHRGRDVNCPGGRVYCTCGYFPLNSRQQTGSLKQSLKEQQERLAQRYERLSREGEDDKSLFSWAKLKRAKDLVDLRIETDRLNDRMNEVRVQEPEKGVLRLSRNQDVGLTREGGVCCKVEKGLATEFHILGKFEVASIEIRGDDDDDSNESLRS